MLGKSNQNEYVIKKFRFSEVDISLQGLDALHRNGLFYALHPPEDHPSVALQKQPMMAGPGAFNMISLKMSEVHIFYFPYFTH